ncbi:Ran BP2/NZF zinc finger-like superfamily protein [Raphanus sativus]|nr:Ran BP2/NZF zinc finger-like superfamily protein [Raphanus sativus]KAJ4886581.1 Ran BP2/NZF zinc finger-like superfamily protein [Raphanus sativus]
MSRPGDWNCRSCTHLNFQRRDSCQRCGDSRSGAGGVGGLDFGDFGGRGMSAFGFTTGSDVRPGDWYCTVGNCGTHNFASRSTCFKCGTFKDESLGGGGGGGIGGPTMFDTDVMRSRVSGNGGRSSWKSGDWICTMLGCNEHNFATLFPISWAPFQSMEKENAEQD